MKHIHQLAVILCLMAAHVGSYARGDSVMFSAAWDPAAVEVAKSSLGPGDLMGQNVANGRAGVFSLPASLADVSRQSERPCPATKTTEVVMYDPEHWPSTPPEERTDVARSVSHAARMVDGKGCRTLGLAPDGQFIGLAPKACQAAPSALASEVDWRRVSHVVLQAQRLMSAQCGGERNAAQYAAFVGDWARRLKAANPAIKVYTSLTFRYTSPDAMRRAIADTRRHVEGYYLAYPTPEKGTECKYCTAGNLKMVIDEIKSR